MRIVVRTVLIFLLFVLSWAASGNQASGQSISESTERADRAFRPADLILAAPINQWDEAIPLGNGLTGGLLWGEGNTIRLSLDRGDLWDERRPETLLRDDWTYQTMQRLVAEGNQARMVELFDRPYDEVSYPTKLPGGRLELTLDPSRQARSFRLDLYEATGHVDLGGDALDIFFSAAEPITLIRITGPTPDFRLIRPDALDLLGYPQAQMGRDAHSMWFVQQAALGLSYAVVVAARRAGDVTLIATAITSSNDDPDPLTLGRRRVEAALDRGYEQLLEPHREWWRRFWETSHVRVPDAAVQQHYDLVKYFYGAASRPDAPPIPLQGVWTADAGTLPPWKGDYHNDLNTQMTYLAYHTAGLVDQGESFINLNWDLLPQYRAFARDFYGVPGAVVPGVMTLGGKPMGGWSQYSLSPTNGAWVAHSFYLHWKYTMEGRFLEERAYPFSAAIGEALRALLEPDEQGLLKLPLSSSPEIYDNTLKAWLSPNSNYDLSIMRWLFEALQEMALALGDAEEAREWGQVLDKLGPLHVEGEAGSLMFAEGEPYDESHRHFSHAMAIHPLGIINMEGGSRERSITTATVERIMEEGTDAWVGYSFSWMSCMLARVGRAEKALHYLNDFARAFTLRNGFHVNGDQSGEGLSDFTYRPFTLEGNFLAMQAVQEMLLQSWGDVVRVFPAVSERWADVSFEDLRAEGAFRVSAWREKGRTAEVHIVADETGLLKLRDPFEGGWVQWNRTDVKLQDGLYLIELKEGEELIGRLIP